MRTTLTIDVDVMRQLEEVARREGLPLEQIVNRTLRRGLAEAPMPRSRRRYRSPTYRLGAPRVPSLERALAVANALEDEEVARELLLHK